MTSCARCHRPACDYSTRACVSTDCGLRSATTFDGLGRQATTVSSSPFGRAPAASACVPPAAGAGGLSLIPATARRLDECASDREADCLVGANERAFHEVGYAA